MSKYLWLFPTLIFTVLILGAARMHPLWGDEAETALFGRNILKYGVPRGWDGTNIMGINNAVVLDKNLINHTSPWLQYYLVAASFKLFGESSFTARLPFIILAILTQPLLYYVVKKITGDKTAAIFASIISALSVQGILFGFQARYYQATNFFGLLLILSAWHIINSGKKYSSSEVPLSGTSREVHYKFTKVVLDFARTIFDKWNLLFVFSSVFFFYSNYVSFAAFFAATIISIIICHPERSRGISRVYESLIRLGLLTLPILALTLPWYLSVKPFASRGAITLGSLPLLISDFLNLFWQSLYQFHFNNVFPAGLWILLLVIVIYQVIKKLTPSFYSSSESDVHRTNREVTSKSSRQARTITYIKPLLFVGSLILIYLSIMSLFSTVAIVDTVFIHGRYTTVALPLFYILAGLIFASLWRINKLFSVVILILYLFTNTLKFTPTKSYFRDLVQEIIHPYPSAAPLVADYLVKNSQPGQTAFVNLDRDHEPLIFFLKDRLKFINRINLVNTRIFPENRGIIPRYIYDFRNQPDWVILYSKRGDDGTFFTMDYRPLPPEVNLKDNYLEHKLPIFFSDLSRPEIDHRSFVEIIPTDPIDFVYIYKKK